jgi:uracil DNA glycosylase
MYDPLRKVPFDKVRVVIVTETPFNIKGNRKFLKAWHDSTGLPIPNHKNYSTQHLNKRGVLFLPVVWNENLTKMDCYPLNFWLLYALSNHTKDRKICFIFSGSCANELAFIIDRRKHLVISTAAIDGERKASHTYPSFKNCNVFARAARWIRENPMSFWRLEG